MLGFTLPNSSGWQRAEKRFIYTVQFFLRISFPNMLTPTCSTEVDFWVMSRSHWPYMASVCPQWNNVPKGMWDSSVSLERAEAKSVRTLPNLRTKKKESRGSHTPVVHRQAWSDQNPFSSTALAEMQRRISSGSPQRPREWRAVSPLLSLLGAHPHTRRTKRNKLCEASSGDTGGTRSTWQNGTGFSHKCINSCVKVKCGRQQQWANVLGKTEAHT